MKKILLILAIAALTSCEKDEDTKPSTPTNENVEQYVGYWAFNSTGCNNSQKRITKGQGLNELIFDGTNATVVNKVMIVETNFNRWDITFGSSSFASVDYNHGLCIGTLTKR